MDKEEINQKILEIKEKVSDGKTNINSIKYTKELEIIPQTEKYAGWQENDIFIITKEDEEKKLSYEIYDENGELIATADENGEIIFEADYLENLKQTIEEKFDGLLKYEDLGIEQEDRQLNLEKMLEEKEDKLKWHSDLTEEQILDAFERGIDEPEGQEYEQFLSEHGIDSNKEKEETNLVKPEESTEEELQQLGNGWQEYSNIIKVKRTDPIYRELEGLEDPLYIAANKNGDFEALTQGENGEPVKSKVINGAKSTTQPVMHIDDSGQPVQKMVPTAVMNTTRSDMKISVKIGQYGYTEAQKLQRAHDNRYIATDIDRVGNKDKEYDVRYQTDKTKQGRDMADNLADNFEERGQEEDNSIDLHEIDVNIEDVKREIVDNAIENYEDMSPEELKEYIRDELINTLGEEDSHIEELTEELKEKVEDEVRFPQRGAIQ